MATTAERGKKRSRADDSADLEYRPNVPIPGPIGSTEASATAVSKTASQIRNVTIDRVPAFLIAKSGAQILSPGWWREMVQTDKF